MDGGIIGAVGSVLAVIGAAYAVYIGRRKVEAEADSVQVASSDKVVQMIMGQLAYMENEVTKLQTLIVEYREQIEKFTTTELALKRRIAVLEDYIRHNGLPVPA